MEHFLQQVSEVFSLMPCQLEWQELESNAWAFWSTEELEYQQSISPIMSAADSVVSSSVMVKLRIKSVFEKISSPDILLVQFWAPIKVNGSNFLSIADQPFVLCKELDKRLSSYRRLCLDTLIPIDEYKEGLLDPPGRVLTSCSPPSYSAAEFPLLQSGIRLGIHSYYAFPVFNLHHQRYLGVFEILSTQPYLRLSELIMGLKSKSFGLYSICNSGDMFFGLSEPPVDDRLDEIEIGLYKIREIHNLPFAQIWIPYSQSASSKVLCRAGAPIYEHSISTYQEFEDVSEAYFIDSGKALVGKAFASHGSCFCKDVTLLSFNEYPLVPSARKASLTQSFAIYLQSKYASNIVFVVECFLPSNEMVVRDTKTFLNMFLSTMNEQLPGFIVASGKELGQRILVEVVKVSPNDELDSFEIGQPLPRVQSLQDGGETTEIDSLCQQPHLQNGENSAAAALLVPSCSLHKRDSLNYERTVEFDLLLPHLVEEAATNRGMVNMDIAHDGHIEDTSETMQLDSHLELPNLETNAAGNVSSYDKLEHSDRYVEQLFEAVSNSVNEATTNNEKIHSQKNNAMQRIERDHGITRKILEQHFGMTLEDAAKNLGVSRATLKRICRVYNIYRWPHRKTSKVNVHVSQGVSFQSVEPCVDGQQCPALSHENVADCLGHKKSPATVVPHDSLMTLKVTYRGDIIKFQLSLSSTRVELKEEVEKRHKISLERFSIKYEDEDNDWILITSDSDLRNGMHSLMALGRTTMRLLVTPKADT